jgi:hypothetical protein
MSRNWFDDLLGFVVPSAPQALVWAVGCALALTTYRKHPKVSLAALLGCLVLLLSVVGGSVLTWWIFEQHRTGAWTAAERNLTGSMVGLARSFASMLGYVLLLVAVFGWRPEPVRQPRPLDVDRLDEVPDFPPTGIRKPDAR